MIKKEINIIDEIISIIENKIPESLKIKTIVELSKTIDATATEEIVKKIKNNKYLLEKIKKTYTRYILEMEEKGINKILNSEKKHVSFLEIAGEAEVIAYQRVENIFNSLKLEPQMTAVVVGCGQLPVTAIHIAEKSNIKEIICLDVIKNSIEKARQLVNKLDIKKINFIHCNGSDYDFSNCDIVYIANMVTPKLDVIKQIDKTALNRPQVILREPYGFGKLWSDHCEPFIGNNLSVESYGPGSIYLSRDVHLKWN